MRKSKNTEGRHAARVGLLLAALLFALPVFTVTVVRGQRASEQPEEPIHLLPPGEIDSARTLRVLDGDTVTEMSFSDYLQGVLRAEMPASFQEDALRAQAVAARTYTYYKMQNGGNHGDTADICTGTTAAARHFWGRRRPRTTGGRTRSAMRPRSRTPSPPPTGR